MAASAEDEASKRETASGLGSEDNSMKARLDGLEQRCAALEREYAVLSRRAEQIDSWTDRYSASMERERKVLAVIELLMRHDRKSRLLLHHVTTFFHLVLTKMRSRGLPLTSVRDLWYKLEEDSVSAAFDDVVMRLGFHGNELAAIRLVLDVVHSRGSNCPCAAPVDPLLGAASGGGDGEVANLILYLQVQEDVDTSIRLALRRAIAVSHCNQMPDLHSATELNKVVSPRFMQQLSQLSLTSSPCHPRGAHSADDVTSHASAESPVSLQEGVRSHCSDHAAAGASGRERDENAHNREQVGKRHSSKCLFAPSASSLNPPAEKPGCGDSGDRVYLSPPPRRSPVCDEPWLPVERSPRETDSGLDFVIFHPPGNKVGLPDITLTQASPVPSNMETEMEDEMGWEGMTEGEGQGGQGEGNGKRSDKTLQEAIPEL